MALPQRIDPFYARNQVTDESALPSREFTRWCAQVASGGSHVTNETPKGVVDGANAAFTLQGVPIDGSLILVRNGMIENPAAYAVAKNVITYATAPAQADWHVAYYQI